MSAIASRWYWTRGGKQGGPVSWEELGTLARAGKIRADDLVLREGTNQWIPARQAQGNVPAGPPPLPSAPVAALAAMPAQPSIYQPRPLHAADNMDEPQFAPQPGMSRGTQHMIRGTLWLVGGIVATALSYWAASSYPGGGGFRIFYGAIVVGIIQFIRGLAAAASE